MNRASSRWSATPSWHCAKRRLVADRLIDPERNPCFRVRWIALPTMKLQDRGTFPAENERGASNDHYGHASQ